MRNVSSNPNLIGLSAMRSLLTRQLLIGLILGILVLPAPVARAQWTVYDPAQYALQWEKRIEEANRWVETINHYARIYENAVEQLTTLTGVLKQAEKLVFHNSVWLATMSDIGRSVRGVFLLKNQLEALVRTRIRAIEAINQRLKNGIFDPDADLRDFEEYLKNSIGRTSQDTVANLERLARMDNQLERWYHDLQIARARRAGTEAQKKKAQENLEKELAKPSNAMCASCISDLKQEISNCDLLIAELDREISRLTTEIEARAKKYNVVLEERSNFGQQVNSTNEAWSDFNKDKDELTKLLDEIEGRSIGTQP
jgi:DNA repair exonuclease SbcCD ATPase subunit